MTSPLPNLYALDKKRTKGPWSVYVQPIANAEEAKAELAEQVSLTEPIADNLYLLSGGGKCPATTGCGPTSKDNAAFIVALENAWTAGELVARSPDAAGVRPGDDEIARAIAALHKARAVLRLLNTPGAR